jgi:hypothetical protein
MQVHAGDPSPSGILPTSLSKNAYFQLMLSCWLLPSPTPERWLASKQTAKKPPVNTDGLQPRWSDIHGACCLLRLEGLTRRCYGLGTSSNI